MTHNALRSISLLLAFSMVPALRAETVTWDSMRGKSLKGTIEVTLLTGEKWKRTDTASFLATEVRFAKNGGVLRRGDIKELVITTRNRREPVCTGLLAGAAAFLLTVNAIGEPGNGPLIPLLLLATPLTAAWAAVTTPLFLIINGPRWLVPKTAVYKIAP